MIAQLTSLHRQKMAQNGRSENCRLANEKKCTTVKVVSGVIIPALFTDYLFRTPSLNGQAFVDDDCLPVSYGPQRAAMVRHRFADPCSDRAFGLHGSGSTGHLRASATRPIEGGAECEQKLFGSRCWYVSALRAAATRLANKPCMVPEQAFSERRCCKGVSLVAWSSAPQAMSCTASINRAVVARPIRRRSGAFRTSQQPLSSDLTTSVGRSIITRVMWRTMSETRTCRHAARANSGYPTPDKTRLSQNSPRLLAVRAGFAFTKSTQPKDSPCSTRS